MLNCKNFYAVIILVLFTFAINGCGGGSGGGSNNNQTNVGNNTPPPQPDPEPALFVQLAGLETASDDLWDETAVRKVLHTFAYGGHATDAQITRWADMQPGLAIVQILTFDQHNTLLSPLSPGNLDRLDTQDGTLLGLANFWESNDPSNRIADSQRTKYDIFGGLGDIGLIWTQAANSRGLNPFRQKIGFWETNYHLATNHLFVPRRVMVRYYDLILGALEDGRPYQEVLAEAAKSAAIAIQYGHRKNVFVNGKCLCNEDFAREYHQLFFGILGADEPDYHEIVSIKNTAAGLTDMRVALDLVYGGFLTEVTFGTQWHTPGVLEILHAGIGGTDATQRIDQLSQFAIEHPESLTNLPVKIIGGLADDNLTPAKINSIQTAWKSMAEKNLLHFLRAYAISTLFHDAARIKYRTSVDRHLLIANLVTLNNEEIYLNLYNPMFGYEDEDVRAFYPSHNVFGGQTSEEASQSNDVFRNNYERVTRYASNLIQSSGERYGRTWHKEWATVIPESAGGGYVVKDVAEWLWQRFVADGLKNLGPLERAHLYPLLETGLDIAYLLNPSDKDRIVTSTDVQADPLIIETINNLSLQMIALDSLDTSERNKANQRIGQAINFIVGTPFMFVEEGR